MSATGTVADAAAWHDVECGSYTADLDLWRTLARERGGPILDIGCGTGRVALELAAAGHEVVGVDADPTLVATLNERAGAATLPARAIVADARSFTVGARSGSPPAGQSDGPPGSSGFPLAILPMQVAQLLGGPTGRARMLAAVRRELAPGGLLALALADPFDAVEPGEARPPLPDVLEIDGWVLSSTPVAVRDEGDAVSIDRIRQAVSPTGDLTEELATVTLDNCAPRTLEDEGRAAGLRVLDARHVPATPDYVGSTVVMLEAPR
ncbi:MAG: class I SAM-dependent methyltransferase [Actinomycetota bacterium]|nr:class I SAM-dependent methyltransferase [Actinomycetota bacterium]